MSNMVALMGDDVILSDAEESPNFSPFTFHFISPKKKEKRPTEAERLEVFALQ